MNRSIPTLLKLFFISFFTLAYTTHTNNHSRIFDLQAELSLREKTVTTKFTQQRTKLLKQLDEATQNIHTDPLYKELTAAFKDLQKEPAYQTYRITLETIGLIGELQAFNHTITHSDLLVKTNAQLDQLRQNPQFNSLIPLLKKQRVALIELLDERDLIESNEKNLAIQQHELSLLIEQHKEEFQKSEPYKNVQALQAKYLNRGPIQKISSTIEKLEALKTQEEIALLKDKSYQDLMRRIEYRDPQFQRPKNLTNGLMDKKQELFLIPIEDTGS